jgi:phosphoribosylaminoimidazole-succinocarboxamide synthase
MPDEFVTLVSQRYIELYERITGLDFVRETEADIITRIENRVSTYLLT